MTLRVAVSPGPLLRSPAMTLTAVFEPAEEGGSIAYVEELPGASTQGETLDEARANLLDAVALLTREGAPEGTQPHGSSRIGAHPGGRRAALGSARR